MSCENNTNRIARLTCRSGLSRLASKNLFYLGAAAGIVGGLLLGRKQVAQATAKHRYRLRRLYRRLTSSGEPPSLIDPRSLPEMPGRQVVTPTPRDRLREKCVECGSSPNSKPGAWYVIDGKPYCQDCAPQGAEEAGKRLEAPAGPTPSALPVSSSSSGRSLLVTPPPAGTRDPIGNADQVAPLNPETRVETTLQRRRIGVKSLNRETGQLYETYVDGYAVLAQKGYAKAETGMGITPFDDEWTITHLASGQKIAGPYSTPEEALQLASVLAQLDWTVQDPIARFSEQEKVGIAVTVKYYDAALEEARAQIAGEEVVEGDDAATALDEMLFSKVTDLGHEHGFQRGYNAGTEAAIEELGMESSVDQEQIDEELTEKEALELERLLQHIPPLEFDDYYSMLYQDANEEGYDEGFMAGYEGVMAQFGPGD
jgi:hypothetical protein